MAATRNNVDIDMQSNAILGVSTLTGATLTADTHRIRVPASATLGADWVMLADEITPAKPAVYLRMPDNNLTRLFIGTSTARAFSVSFKNVTTLENMPAFNVSNGGGFQFGSNGSHAIGRNITTLNGNAMEINASGPTALGVIDFWGNPTGYGNANAAGSQRNLRINPGGEIQIGGPYTLDASSIFTTYSVLKGSAPFPRMTQAQRLAIATPITGLHVYQTDTTEGVYVKKAAGWAFAY